MTRIGLLRAAGPRLAALALGALLAGCSGGGSERPGPLRQSADLLRSAVPELLGLEEEAAPPPPLTRAEINRIPAALVTASRADEPASYFAARAVNNGRVAYLNPLRQTLTFHGAALAATHGLGVDLAGYRSDPEEDPLVRNRPLAEWPSRITRVYRFHEGMGRLFSRAFLCAPRAAGPERVVIAEVAFDLVKVEERCASPAHAFTNVYWVDPGTGFVWRSSQWAGPELGPLVIEVLRPFAP